MKRFTTMAAALAATAAFAVSVSPAAAADQCRSACDKSFQQCSKSRDSQACLPSWGQCKAKCKRTTSSVSMPKAAKAVQTAKR